MSALGIHTFPTRNVVPQLSKASDHRVILHTFPPLATQAPSIPQSDIVLAIEGDGARGTLAPTILQGVGWAQLYRIRVAAQDGGHGRVLGARVLLDGRRDGDALGNNEGHRIDSDGDWAAAILHAWGLGSDPRSRGGA